MNRFVVLLRGVNVGKANRVPMAEWRTAMQGLGLQSVRTLLNSGNAVFASTVRSTAQLAEQIGASMQTAFAVDTPVIVKHAAEFEQAVAQNPIPIATSEHARFLLILTQDNQRLQALQQHAPLLRANERFIVTEHAAYLHCADGILESKLGATLLGRAGRHITSRNWATTLKILAMLREPVA